MTCKVVTHKPTEADSTSDSFPNESGGGDIDGSSMTIRPPAPPVALAADPASDNPPTAVVAAPTNQPTMRVSVSVVEVFVIISCHH